MWQRKQTIFLLIVMLLMASSIFFPIWMASFSEEKAALFPIHYSVTREGVTDIVYFPYCGTAILAIASATLAFFGIKNFENRRLQIKLGALNSLFMAGSIGLAVYFVTALIKEHQVAGRYGIGLWLPAIAMVSNMVANRFIRRDEKIVEDSNRVR